MNKRDHFVSNEGVEIPGFVYGTAWKKDRTKELVVQAVVSGFRGIDTACQPKHYDEALVGEALAELKRLGFERKALFIQTKSTPVEGQDPDRTPYDKDATLAVQVAQSFQVSQKNLQTDYVDSLLLHSPLDSFSDLMEVWGAMESIYDAKGTRQLGISNCYDLDLLKELYAAARIKPAVVQNRFYAQTGYDKAFRLWCREKGIIYQSFWSLTANPHLMESGCIHELSYEYGKSSEQILYRYLNQSGIVPLNGTTSQRHMKEDLEIFEIELSDEAMESIDQLLE